MWTWTKTGVNWIRGFLKGKGVWQGLTFVSCLGLVIAILQYCNSQSQLELLREQYDEAKSADLTIDYRSVNNYDPPKLTISNDGDRRADSVWILEKIFLYGDDSSIYECDLPRFAYIVYNGSTQRMFDLNADEDTVINYVPSCFDYYKERILEKYPGQLVVQWIVEYSQDNSPTRLRKSEYFVLSRDNMPLSPQDMTGGYGIIEKIIQYERYGPIKQLSCVLGELVFLNYPNYFYLDSSGIEQTLLPGLKPNFKRPRTLMINIEDRSISHTREGYHAFVWECDSSWFMGKNLISDTSLIY